MSLAPGVRFGPYQIIAAIGAGGMGEVYRARDVSDARFLMIKELSGAEEIAPSSLTVVLNWFDEIKRIAPSRK